MSSSFSVNPVGLPVAAAIVRPASSAADDGVATQLPTRQSVTATDGAGSARLSSHGQNGALANQVTIDRAAASVVYQLVDKRTNIVVKQYPEQAILRRRAYFRTLDAMRDNAEVPRIDRRI